MGRIKQLRQSFQIAYMTRNGRILNKECLQHQCVIQVGVSLLFTGYQIQSNLHNMAELGV